MPPYVPAIESRFVDVAGHRIHYRDTGRGPPMLFVHGNPTSSYVWRNVLAPVAQGTRRRCLALDLLGFGLSDKPNLPYTLSLHAQIVAGFIEKLRLKDLVLVAEDWGGPLAAHYAVTHPYNVGGLGLMETFMWPLSWKVDFRACVRRQFKMMRGPLGYWFIQVLNMLPGKMIPRYSEISPQDLQYYVDACPTVGSRRAMREFPKLLPIDGRPWHSLRFIETVYAGCANAPWPMLWLRPTPGLVAAADYPPSLAPFEAFRKHVPRMVVKEFGPGRHFLSEDNPQRVVELLEEWLGELYSPQVAAPRAAALFMS